MIPFARVLKYGNKVEKPEGMRYTCSDYSSMYSFLKDGVLYLSGINNYYQLGNNTTTASYNAWVKVPETDSIRLCSTGFSQTIYITHNGKVMITGNDCTANASAPSLRVWTDVSSRFTAADMTKVVYVGIDRYGVMMVMDDGSVWGCGTDNSGWSGQGSSTVGFFTFRKLYTGDAIVALPGTATSRILLKDGTVLSAGANTYHQCNASATAQVVTFTESFPGVDPSLINQFKLCNNNCIIYLSDKRYFGTGWGSSGALGDGDTTSLNNKFYAGTLTVAPKNLRSYMPYICSSSGSVSLYLGEDNFIYSTGYRGTNLRNATSDLGTFGKVIQSATPYSSGMLFAGSNSVMFDPEGDLVIAASSPKNTTPTPQANVPTLGMGAYMAFVLPL